MKSLMLYLRTLLQEMEELCSVSAAHDWKTIMRRVEHEGLSFLTITLPSFCKDFEQALALGGVAPSHFESFSRRECLPRFLGGFTELVFDRASGVLLKEPSVDAIFAVRQITLTFSKINLPCSDTRKKRALEQYLQCEWELERDLEAVYPSLWARYNRIATLLWSGVRHDVLQSIRKGEFRPRHGPGSTADSLLGNQKWAVSDWPERLEAEFDIVSNLAPNERYVSYLSDVKFSEPGEEQPVKVTLVPKTLKTPRVIAMEPTHMMYVQQGLYALISEAIHRDELLRSFIGWDSAEPNQSLACLGSRDGSLATLDLSEASDRVSTLHVRGLFPGWDDPLVRKVMACRSRKAEVPGYGVIPLTKFASMGSALTFPLEAMVFLTIVFLGIEQELNTRLTPRDIQSFRNHVRVYGDDIIVPVEYAVTVMKTLHSFGFRVNTSKSFWTGKFRESCGKEYYDGSDVSVVRVRHLFPSDRRHARELQAMVALRNQLYFAGCWRTARWCDLYLERLIPLPTVDRTARVLGRHSFLGYETQRLDSSLHTPLVRGVVVKSPIPASRLDGELAMLKCFLVMSGVPNPDEKHLEYAGRPHSSYTKVGWYRPY